MPELPEVETIRRDLNKFLSGKKITAVEVRQPRLVKPSVTKLKKALVGARVGRVSRRGKMLVWHLPKQQKLLVHLKMTGQIVWRQGGGKLMVGGHPIIGVDTVANCILMTPASLVIGDWLMMLLLLTFLKKISAPSRCQLLLMPIIF